MPSLSMSGVVALSSVIRWPSDGPEREGLCFADASVVSSALRREVREKRAVLGRRERRVYWRRSCRRSCGCRGCRYVNVEDMMFSDVPI